MPVMVNDAVGDGATVQLKRAILLYGPKGEMQERRSDSMVATIHDVAWPKNRPVILPGVPVNTTVLQELVVAMQYNKYSLFLPPEIVSFSYTRMIWHCPRAVREIWFAARSKKERMHRKMTGAWVTHPNLLFIAEAGKGLSVFALASDARPKPTDRLYVPPYFNIFNSFQVCRGSASFPNLLIPDSIAGFERGFFESKFTHDAYVERHSGANTTPKLTAHKGGHWAFWTALKGKAKKKVPTEWLTPTAWRLKDVIDGKNDANSPHAGDDILPLDGLEIDEDEET